MKYTQKMYKVEPRESVKKHTRENKEPPRQTSLQSSLVHTTKKHCHQVDFYLITVTDTRSVTRQDLSNNLNFFTVPETSIQSIYSKLAMRVFDVYANILKYMYSTRFREGSTRSETSPTSRSTPIAVTPLIRTVDISRPDKHK